MIGPKVGFLLFLRRLPLPVLATHGLQTSNTLKIALKQAFNIGMGGAWGTGPYKALRHVGSKGLGCFKGFKGVPRGAALFVPTNKEDWRSWDYWINWCSFWGGLCYCSSGPFFVVPDLDIQVYRVENAIGFGLGSLLFVVIGVLDCLKPSVAMHKKVGSPTLVFFGPELFS
jgi:hypothetical protein